MVNVVYADGHVVIPGKSLLLLTKSGQYNPFIDCMMDKGDCTNTSNYPQRELLPGFCLLQTLPGGL